MGEPSRDQKTAGSKTVEELLVLLHHEFPQAQLVQVNDEWSVYTLHGVGQTEVDAITNALREIARMKSDGASLPTILDDIEADLKLPGMSRARHTWITDMLKTASNCLNDGLLTKTVPWIMSASYTRKIEDFQRRADNKLAMTALDMQQQEKARLAAGTKANHAPAEYVPGVGYNAPISTLAKAEFMLSRRQRK